MTKLEQLKKEIQRLNPEIMELKFGCEVIAHNVKQILDKDKESSLVSTLYNKNNYLFPEQEITEILGRPITLEDVLAVLEKLYPSKYSVNSTGEILEDTEDTGFRYHIGDSFDNQSYKFYDFIHSLICK